VDTVAPVDAILGVRYNEAEKAITRAETRGLQLGSDRFLRVSVDPERFGIALGLQLSRTSFEVLSLLVGRAEWCPQDYKEKNRILMNSCVARKLYETVHKGS
jgi:hypothetical protein